MTYDVEVRGHKHTLSVEHGHGSSEQFLLDGRPCVADARFLSPRVLSLLIDGRSYRVVFDPRPGAEAVVVGEHRMPFTIADPRSLRSQKRTSLQREWRAVDHGANARPDPEVARDRRRCRQNRSAIGGDGSDEDAERAESFQIGKGDSRTCQSRGDCAGRKITACDRVVPPATCFQLLVIAIEMYAANREFVGRQSQIASLIVIVTV